MKNIPSYMKNKHQPKAVKQECPTVKREPRVFKLLPSETILPNDYPINEGYVYIIDNVFARADMRTDVIGYKIRYNVSEIRRCDLFGHEGASLGDKCE